MVSARPIIAVAAVFSLGFWFIEIDRAFGLPAHPLLIHAAAGLRADPRPRSARARLQRRLVRPLRRARGRVRRGDAGLHAAGRRGRRSVPGEPGTGGAAARASIRPCRITRTPARCCAFVVFGLTFALIGMLFARPKVLRAVVVLLALRRDLLHDPHRSSGVGGGVEFRDPLTKSTMSLTLAIGMSDAQTGRCRPRLQPLLHGTARHDPPRAARDSLPAGRSSRALRTRHAPRVRSRRAAARARDRRRTAEPAAQSARGGRARRAIAVTDRRASPAGPSD